MANEEVKDFVAINFSKYFKYTRKNLYFKLNEEQNPRNVPKSFYIILTTPDEVEKYTKMTQSNSSNNFVHHYNIMISNLFDPELQLIYTKQMIKIKLKDLLNELKNFKFQTIFVLDYKKTSICKICHSSAKLIASS